MLTALYVGTLIWLDSKRGLFVGLVHSLVPLAVAMGLSMVSFFVRYLRWRFILSHEGYPVPFARGFMAYLSGFAYTATPGKVGELYRIQQFSRFQVPGSKTFAAFLLERSLDLVVVLLLSLFCIFDSEWLALAVGFVTGVVAVVLIATLMPKSLARVLDSLPLSPRIQSIGASVVEGFSDVRRWLSWSVLTACIAYGLVAWFVTSLAFIWIVHSLGISAPLLKTLGAYPLAMLVGAASLIPGGVGSTEATLSALLTSWGTDASSATLAAIAIRFSTMWFSIMLGMISMVCLTFQRWPPNRVT